jgi:ubiquitin-protein ligase
MTIASWLAHVLCLLETPDLDNPVEVEVAQLYKHDRSLFEYEAKKWTKKYASL